MASYKSKKNNRLFEQGLKECSNCHKIKLINEFSKSNITRHGLRYYCKECCNNAYQKYKIENPSKIIKKVENYKERNKIKSKEYYIDNKKEIYLQQTIYRKENKKNINNQRNKRNKERRKTDKNFKLVSNFRTRIYKALKNNSKSGKTLELLGCSIEELKKHLESQFVPGMNWDNYGLWHIDHKIPCASFDLSKPEEQRKCFNYKNLQPLWAEDNIKKGIK